MSKASLSIVDLERLLKERRGSLQKLSKQRSELQKKLDVVDREIAKLGGSGKARTAGGRVRNDQSLVAVMASVLKGKKPMKVGEVLQAVLSAGYQSTSANFRGIVNQTLIKEKQFHQVDRGTYTVK
jgi:hypothetical protein